ncbi:MAG: large-conductance mechanosensitive channel protein MscL [Bacteroidota bacterium]
MALIQEFKKFISRGNVLDLAVGIIIGAAFGKIVNSLVNDILLPPLGMLIGRVDFKDLKLVIGGETGKEVFINYGMFIQVVIEFLIVAWAVFMVIKGFNAMQRKTDVAAPPAPTPSEALLTEIRDLLKK